MMHAVIFRRCVLWAIPLGALVATAAHAQGRWPHGQRGKTPPQRGKAMTAKDLVGSVAVSDPQISPDGRQVAFVVRQARIPQNDGFANLWVVPMDGGQARRLTTTDKSDSGPIWSPDGRHLYFVSSRKGSPAIWRVPAAGGEPEAVGGTALGVGGPLVFSPRGDRILFGGKAYPQCKDDPCNDREAKRRAGSKVVAELYDRLLYRHWNHWRHGKVNHIFALTLAGRRVADLTPGPHDAPPISLGGSPDYAVSPDGREVCFVKNTEAQVATSTNNDLFVMPAGGGNARRITPNKANDHSPAYSPDGRFLAYLAMRVPRYEADRLRLVLYDRRARTHRILTEDFDRSIHEFVWSPDGQGLYFTADDRGYVPIFGVKIAGGAVQRLVEKVHAQHLRVAPDGKSLVFVSQATHLPTEIYRASVEGGEPTRLTTLQRDFVERVRMHPVEHLWYAGAGGKQIHALVIKPPDFRPGRRYPMVVMIHGGPQGMSGDSFHPRWNAQLFAAPGYVLLMPNFHGSTGYGQDFTDAIGGDWGGKPYEDVMKSVEAAAKRFNFIDPKRVCAVGASYGGYLVNWIGTQTTRFRCLITHAGVYDLQSKYGTTEELWFPEREFQGTPWTNPEMYRRWSPSTHVARWKTPTLVIHGQHDYRVTVGQGMQLFTALQRQGVPSQFLYFPDENHFVQKPQNRLLWWKTMHQFLARHLKGGR